MKNKNYGILNIKLIDRIIEKKRLEMLGILKQKISKKIMSLLLWEELIGNSRNSRSSS